MVCAIWNLPYSTHYYLLPPVCQCLPVFDALCRRSINFARSCVSHESQLIIQITSYCIHFARCRPTQPKCLNILFRVDWFQIEIEGIPNGSITLFNRITATPQPTFEHAHAASRINSLALETADSRFFVTSSSQKRNWPISLIELPTLTKRITHD